MLLYKLTNFSSAINRNRFQLSPQIISSRSSYDVILVTFQNGSQSKHLEAMDFALLQAESPSQEYFLCALTPKRKLSMLLNIYKDDFWFQCVTTT